MRGGGDVVGIDGVVGTGGLVRDGGGVGNRGVQARLMVAPDHARVSVDATRAPRHGPSWSAAARELLMRAHLELDRAERSADPAERFRHAHLAALRTAAAVVAGHPPVRGRGRPPSVWHLADRVAPELGAWTAYFAAGAPTRAAIEAGRDIGLAPSDADEVVSSARRFLHVVENAHLARAS